MNEIEPFLFLGTTAEIPTFRGQFPNGFVLCVLENWSGDADATIPIFDPTRGKADIQKLNQATDVIQEMLRQNRPILVCCGASVERSPLVVAYYLARRWGITLSQAYSIIRQKHPIAQDRSAWL